MKRQISRVALCIRFVTPEFTSFHKLISLRLAESQHVQVKDSGPKISRNLLFHSIRPSSLLRFTPKPTSLSRKCYSPP